MKNTASQKLAAQVNALALEEVGDPASSTRRRRQCVNCTRAIKMYQDALGEMERIAPELARLRKVEEAAKRVAHRGVGDASNALRAALEGASPASSQGKEGK